jgi:hypothetical protein
VVSIQKPLNFLTKTIQSIMIRKVCVFVVAIIATVLAVNAQSGLTSLSNLYVTITSPGDTAIEIESLQYLSDSGSVPERVQLNVELNISAPAALDHVVLHYGTSVGSSDVLNMELTVAQMGGAYYLHYSGMLFPIQSGHAVIRKLIPASTLAGPCHLSIQGYDTGSSATNLLTLSNIH